MWHGLLESTGASPWDLIADWSRAEGEYKGSIRTATDIASENVGNQTFSSGFSQKFIKFETTFVATPDDFIVSLQDRASGYYRQFWRSDTYGNLFLGAGAAAGLTDTAGFIHIQTCNGTPTGVPAHPLTGTAPMLYDTSTQTLFVYAGGAWQACIFGSSRVRAASAPAAADLPAFNIATWAAGHLVADGTATAHFMRATPLDWANAPCTIRVRAQKDTSNYVYIATNGSKDIAHFDLNAGVVANAGVGDAGGFVGRSAIMADGATGYYWCCVQPYAMQDHAVIDVGLTVDGITRASGAGLAIYVSDVDLYQVRGT
jgi:hypothetical protein